MPTDQHTQTRKQPRSLPLNSWHCARTTVTIGAGEPALVRGCKWAGDCSPYKQAWRSEGAELETRCTQLPAIMPRRSLAEVLLQALRSVRPMRPCKDPASPAAAG